MAQKARIFQVTLRNGHETWNEYHAAHSEAALRSQLQFNPDVRLVAIKNLNFHTITVSADYEYNTVTYLATIDSQSVQLEVNTYLRQQFAPQTNVSIQALNEFNDPGYP
jgi:serine kinase of HPr protein (carbohydrate metabolism regulator)